MTVSQEPVGVPQAPASLPPGAVPYRLRLTHEGLLSLLVERAGRRVRFDPAQPPVDDDIVVLTWDWPEHLRATESALRGGARPDVVAAPPILDWLEGLGAPRSRLHTGSADLDGLKITLRDYQPIPYATPPEAVRKLRSVMLRPDRAVRRLRSKLGLPRCSPQIAAIALEDGGRLVHLNLSLHQGTDLSWLDQQLDALGQADWLLLGADFGEQAAVEQLLPRLGAHRILLVDLLSEVRKSIGMPVEILTPLCDRLRAQGHDAYVFPAQARFLFET